MAFRINEATIEHHGSIQDLLTFLDPDGNPYDLIATDIPKSAKSGGQGSGKSQGQGGDQSDSNGGSGNNQSNDNSDNNQNNRKQPPDPTVIYVDGKTNKEYKWNSKTRQFEEYKEA